MMKYKFYFSLVVLSLLLLTACANRAPKEENWPSDMPSRAFFVAAYEADTVNKEGQDLEEYLLWVIRFYKGWELYRNGWTQVTADALLGVKDPQRAIEIHSKMNLIGSGIACEWAKNKNDRRVLTRHVVVWGNALIESIKHGELEEIKLINRVLNDLNGLLDKNIDLDEVKADRYYARDKDDVFG